MRSPEQIADVDRVQYRELAKIAVNEDPRIAAYLRDG